MGELGTVATWGAAFIAGLLSVFSPCVMPLMPAYLSLVSGVSIEELCEEANRAGLRRRVLTACAGFVVGFSAIFIALGASATYLGRVLRTWRIEIRGFEIGIAQVAGLLIIVMGLHMAGVMRIPGLYRDRRFHLHRVNHTFWGTALVGAAFAFGWSPCIGPILGGILTLAGGRDTVWQGIGLLSVYSAGLAVPFFLAGWSIEFFLHTFQRVRRHFRTFEVVSGCFLIAIGALIFTEQLARLNSYFTFLNRFVTALEQTFL